MLFTSPVFLFAFLPGLLLLNLLAPKSFRNVLLLCASLLFYAWGEGRYVLIMLVSILFNFGMSYAVLVNRDASRRKLLLGLAIAGNLLLLMYFKYAWFLLSNLASLLGVDYEGSGVADIHLPIGISFFTFQAISFLVDTYRDPGLHPRSLLKTGLYISLFPQLIAGPIVRFHDVAAQLSRRSVDLALFHSGVQRFIFGLSKKMLIANPLGLAADTVFALPGPELTPALAWLGILCYTLQIYFDFSGYSDMAIGLGRMFGFRFLENFNYPYIASSVREFWRRWHISLSNWFRDYLYIPLGGNRAGPARTYLNLVLVFFLCGLWHGASWNFVIWGLLHGVFLALERALPPGRQDVGWQLLGRLYVLLFVMFAWVFFRADTLPQALDYLAAMLAMGEATAATAPTIASLLTSKLALELLVACVVATPAFALLHRRMAAGAEAQAVPWLLYSYGLVALQLVLLLLCLGAVAAGAYNPFIYFRF